ncbi:MAG: ankyrin repeat domain-containing protein [Planctomycetota bacterium]|nr:MAG: ankyrin repeat domain-containing protein [Planctomycetota bacterium]
MKLGLPLKLGIFVVVLFSVVIAACLLFKPVKTRWFVSPLHSEDAERMANAVDDLLDMGEKGKEKLIKDFPDGKDAAHLIIQYWQGTYVSPTLDDDLQEALIKSVEKGYVAATIYFIFKGADVNEGMMIERFGSLRSYAGLEEDRTVTLLHIAADNNRPKIVPVLLEHGAKINIRDERGRTPLDLAVMRGHEKIADLLRARGGKTGEELRREAGKK